MRFDTRTVRSSFRSMTRRRLLRRSGGFARTQTSRQQLADAAAEAARRLHAGRRVCSGRSRSSWTPRAEHDERCDAARVETLVGFACPDRFTRRRVALQWRLRGRPLPPPHVVKQLAILGYQRHADLHTFVETGTFTGEMVEAMRPHFRPHHLHRDGARDPRGRPVRRFAGDPRVELLLGDSGTSCPCARADSASGAVLARRTLHGRQHRPRQEDSPVKAELTALLRHPVRDHLVLIDDARLFTGAAGIRRSRSCARWIARERPGSRRAGRGRHHPLRVRR